MVTKFIIHNWVNRSLPPCNISYFWFSPLQNIFFDLPPYKIYCPIRGVNQNKNILQGVNQKKKLQGGKPEMTYITGG